MPLEVVETKRYTTFDTVPTWKESDRSIPENHEKRGQDRLDVEPVSPEFNSQTNIQSRTRDFNLSSSSPTASSSGADDSTRSNLYGETSFSVKVHGFTISSVPTKFYSVLSLEPISNIAKQIVTHQTSLNSTNGVVSSTPLKEGDLAGNNSANQVDGNSAQIGDAPVANTENILDLVNSRKPLKVVCLRLSIHYFEHELGNEEEEEDFREEEVGVLRAYAVEDSLAKVRTQLYQQLESDRIPIKFHFLKPHDDTSGGLFWVETIPWHQEVNYTLRTCLSKNGTLLLTSPSSIVKLDRDNLQNKTIEEVKALWERERKAFLMEIHQLESRLAQALHQGEEFSPDSSLLKRSLLGLKKEGFIEKDVDQLEKEYLAVYTQHDADSVFTSNETNPFRFMWRRMAEDPKRVRIYLESLQSILLQYRIRKTRLTSKFWSRILRDMHFVNDPAYFAAWAKNQPWTADDAEKAAYLGSLVLSDSVGNEDYMILLDPVPGTDVPTQTVAFLGQSQSVKEPSNATSNNSLLNETQSKRTIALSAAAFHLKAVQKHEVSSIASQSEATELSSHLKTATSRTALPTDHPCDHFEVDVLAAQFGICICGFPRWDHEKQTRAAKGVIAAHPHPLHVESNPGLLKASSPCSSYELDVNAKAFGACRCGFSRFEHNPQGDNSAYSGQNTLLRPVQLVNAPAPCSSFRADPSNIDRCICGVRRSEHGPQNNVVILKDHGAHTRLHSTSPCNSFQLDIRASRYGVCLCGYDKVDHRVQDYIEPNDVPIQRIPHDDESKLANSQERAQYAFRWIEGEISRLINHIEAVGKKNAEGNYEVTFGELFARYQNISDTLVGILIRAKRRKIIDYKGGLGDLLLQGVHDKVLITLFTDQANHWRRARGVGGTDGSL